MNISFLHTCEIHLHTHTHTHILHLSAGSDIYERWQAADRRCRHKERKSLQALSPAATDEQRGATLQWNIQNSVETKWLYRNCACSQTITQHVSVSHHRLQLHSMTFPLSQTMMNPYESSGSSPKWGTRLLTNTAAFSALSEFLCTFIVTMN